MRHALLKPVARPAPFWLETEEEWVDEEGTDGSWVGEAWREEGEETVVGIKN